MAPQQTRDLKTFTLLLLPGLVTFSFPTLSPPPSSTTASSAGYRTRITIPRGSPWSPGAHWHEHYVEHVRVIKGRVRFTTNGVVSVMGPEDGGVTFQKFDVHDFGRADGGKVEGEDGDAVIDEWTELEDGFKKVFFYNVMSAFADPSLGSSTATTPPTFTLRLLLQLLATIPYADNYIDPFPLRARRIASAPVLGSLLFGAKWAFTHALYALGGTVGGLVGYQKWLKEYTPRELWAVAERGPVPKGGKKTE